MQCSVMKVRVTVEQAFCALFEWVLVVVEDREHPRVSWESYLVETRSFWLRVRRPLIRDRPGSHVGNGSETV